MHNVKSFRKISIVLFYFYNIVQGKHASISRMQWLTAIDTLSDYVKMLV